MRLVVVLASKIQKSGTGDNTFVKWERTFGFDRPDRSKGTIFKDCPKYSGRTKRKWSIPFDVPTKISGILGLGGGGESQVVPLCLQLFKYSALEAEAKDENNIKVSLR